jgi:hypothetical protein
MARVAEALVLVLVLVLEPVLLLAWQQPQVGELLPKVAGPSLVLELLPKANAGLPERRGLHYWDVTF